MMLFLLNVWVWLQSSQGGVTFLDLRDAGPDRGIAWLILSTFALIALALLITIGIGAGVGFLRIWILRRFPHNRLNGPEDDSMTRLHLTDDPRPKAS